MRSGEWLAVTPREAALLLQGPRNRSPSCPAEGPPMRTLLALLGAVLLSAGPPPALAGEPPDPQALANRIDAHLDAALKAAGVRPAPRADDTEFLRRAYLDLVGRIPHPRDVHDFLADTAPDKRRGRTADLLAGPGHARPFANVWRALLLPEASAGGDARFLQAGLEAWLRQRLRANVGYDRLVRELLASPAGAP